MRGMLMERIYFNSSTRLSSKGSDWIYILIYFNRLMTQTHSYVCMLIYNSYEIVHDIIPSQSLWPRWIRSDLYRARNILVELELRMFLWCFLKISYVGTCQHPMLTRTHSLGGWIYGGLAPKAWTTAERKPDVQNCDLIWECYITRTDIRWMLLTNWSPRHQGSNSKPADFKDQLKYQILVTTSIRTFLPMGCQQTHAEFKPDIGHDHSSIC